MRKHIVTDLKGNIISIEDFPADVDPAEQMRRIVHDCPECQALMALGEQPHIGTGADLEPKPRPFARRPRWRHLKRKR